MVQGLLDTMTGTGYESHSKDMPSVMYMNMPSADREKFVISDSEQIVH